MASTLKSGKVLRFGAFELDAAVGELRKNGMRIRLQGQPLQLLLVLLDSPGELVSRDALRERLWADTFVDFEHSLNTAVKKLRQVLGDNAENPIFIETVPRSGYRFFATVQTIHTNRAGLGLPSTEGSPATDSQAAAPAVPSTERPATAAAAPKSRRGERTTGRWLLAAGSGILALIAVGIWYLSRALPPPKITDYVQITHDGRQKLLGGSDGSRLYFTQLSPQALEQVSVNGGEVAPVPINIPAMEMVLLDVSHDGSNALIGHVSGHVAAPLWVASLIGGSARRLGDWEAGVFSPDGLSIVYSTLEGDVFLARMDGTENRKLAHVNSAAHSFSWSPDGKAIRFARDGFLWEMSSDGSGIHRLLPDWKERGNQCCGKWTRDGHFYLFELNSPSSGSQIWALDERRRLFGMRSSAPIRLTSGPIRWGQLVPSRDGTKIFAEGITPRGELSRIDPRTATLQPFLGGISAEFTAFSPDGKSVAYVLYPDGTLWKADRDGTNRMQLAGGPEYIYNPRWSADSKQILFSSGLYDPLRSSVYLVSANGGGPQKLLPGERMAMLDAYWSPDGKKVVFYRGAIGESSHDLCILDLGTGRVSVLPGSNGMFSPRWSPDGRFILAKYLDTRRVLPVFEFKTQRWSMIPVNGDVEFPSFSRDNRYIYFLRWGRDQGVIRIPVTGGKEEPVIDMTHAHITGYMGLSMSLDPTDAPLVLRDVGSDDIYALTLEDR